jgi:hypothetical protein
VRRLDLLDERRDRNASERSRLEELSSVRPSERLREHIVEVLDGCQNLGLRGYVSNEFGRPVVSKVVERWMSVLDEAMRFRTEQRRGVGTTTGPGRAMPKSMIHVSWENKSHPALDRRQD